MTGEPRVTLRQASDRETVFPDSGAFLSSGAEVSAVLNAWREPSQYDLAHSFLAVGGRTFLP